jgi:hypothetical protein
MAVRGPLQLQEATAGSGISEMMSVLAVTIHHPHFGLFAAADESELLAVRRDGGTAGIVTQFARRFSEN